MSNKFLINSSLFCFTNSLPKNNVSTAHKIKMRKLLSPSFNMKKYLQNAFIFLGISPKHYDVIHIRSGDNYLINYNNSKYSDGDLKEEFFKYCNSIFLKIEKHLLNLIGIVGRSGGVNKILLICDNNDIKKQIYDLLVNRFHTSKSFCCFDFCCLFGEIVHFGEGVVQTPDGVKNSMLDFFLISQSNNVVCFTCYEHGSGFSLWTSIMYDIPYMCIKL
jgi:hypothetical protein